MRWMFSNILMHKIPVIFFDFSNAFAFLCLLKKFMQVEVDEICMCTKFGGHVLSGLLFKTAKFPFGPWTIVHGGQKIELAQKIHASRG